MNDTKAARTVRIEETTVGNIDGWRVTVGNIMKAKWKADDGKEREGLTAEIGLYDENKAAKGERTLGEGAKLTIAGKSWRLARVVAGKGADNGHVELVSE